MKKIKILLLTFLVALPLLVILRIFQLNFAIDSITGFTMIAVTDFFLYGILLLFLIFSLFLVFFFKKSPIDDISNIGFNHSKNNHLIIFLYSILLVYTYTANISVLKTEYTNSVENVSLLIIFIFKLITATIGFLAGFLLLVELFKFFIQKDKYKVSVIPCFITITHSILALLTFFTKERTIVTISQNLLTLFFWIFAVQFIFAFSKHLTSSKIGNPTKETFFFAMMTSILGAITIISPLFVKEQTYYSLFDSERLITVPIFIFSTNILIPHIVNIFKKN